RCARRTERRMGRATRHPRFRPLTTAHHGGAPTRCRRTRLRDLHALAAVVYNTRRRLPSVRSADVSVESESSPRSVELHLDTGLKRDVGKIGLLFTGVGSIIGSGWLFGAFDAAKLVGPA